MPSCPRCHLSALKARPTKMGTVWTCDRCGGLAVNTSGLNGMLGAEGVGRFVAGAGRSGTGGAACPGCQATMKDVSAGLKLRVDCCLSCRLVWLDRRELDEWKYQLQWGEKPFSESSIPNSWWKII